MPAFHLLCPHTHRTQHPAEPGTSTSLRLGASLLLPLEPLTPGELGEGDDRGPRAAATSGLLTPRDRLVCSRCSRNTD